MAFPESFECHRASFLESLRVRNYSPASLSGYRCSLTKFFRFLEKQKVESLEQIQSQTLFDYQLSLVERNYSNHSISTWLYAVLGFFAYLENARVLTKNPCKQLNIPRPKTLLPRGILTTQEVQALLNAPNLSTPNGIRDKAILELFYSTGLRLHEMTSLTIYDLDLRNRLLRITGKGKKEAILPIGEKAVFALERYLKEVRRLWIKRNPSERVLWLGSLPPHSALKSQAIKVMIKTYGRKIHLGKRVYPHLLRHTFASHLVSNGASVIAVQKLLRHSSLATTQIYTHVTINEIKEGFRKAHPRAKRKKQSYEFPNS